MSSTPFVPSPQWQSESPHHPPSSSTGNSPWRRVQRAEGLWSPVPPPPANLYPDSPDAFNVDPGVPFLATAGTSDVADSEDESEAHSPRRKRFVGGFVTGIRDTVRRSLRRPRRSSLKQPAFPFEQQEIRDSGYASSSVTAPAPSPARHPSSTEAQISHEQGVRPPTYAQSYTTPHHPTYSRFATDDNYRKDFDAVAELQGRMSLFSGTVSAETAPIQYGSDYAKMEAPLDTEDSLSAYIKRTTHFVRQISALPFSSRTRVTYDHYPEQDLRDDPRRRPFIEWHRPGYGPTNYSPADDSKPVVSSPTIPSQPYPAIYTPHRVPAAPFDLREEFNDTASVPAPAQPQPVQIVSGPRPTFHAVDTKRAPPRQTLTIAPVDSWAEAINTTRRSARKRRVATPFHRAMSVDAETNEGEWQQYPHYRDGYVPAELAEGHYGSRYGPGIHSARAGPIFPGSGPSSVTTPKYHR